MKINCFSIVFWFNIIDNHNDILNDLQENFKEEYETFNVKNKDDNLIHPIIMAFNNEKMTNLSMSQINLQYTMDKVSMTDFNYFKNRALELFEILSNENILVLHSEILINGEVTCENVIEKMTKNTLNPSVVNEDFVDTTLKFGKKEEDLFYKIITILNKKQIKLPKKVDEFGRLIPIPLISWHGAFVENEIIDISYEINDKYSFDFTKDYHTTEFYLNKMLYILENNFASDIDNLLDKGIF